MSPLLDLSLRVLAAAFVGAVIDYEREVRAKEAGMRTHVLVALGAAMFMIVSQFGFEGASRFDAARVAAGVVGGLGFLGGGIIMKTKNHVTALTSLGRRVKDYSLSKQENGYKLEVVLHVPKKEYGVNLLTSLSSIPGVQLENFN